MKTNRLEAFTDGVVAIAITIMVLGLKAPPGTGLEALRAGAPMFLGYVLSFINVGIFWNNHHHMFHATDRVDGKVLWANLFLLFGISLIPFAIRWMDEGHFAALPTAFYGATLALTAFAYVLLERAIIACNGPASKLAQAVGADWKSNGSLLAYCAGIGLAFVSPWISIAIYVAVAFSWFIPDRRIETHFKA